MYFDQHHARAVDDYEADPVGQTLDEVCGKRLKKGFTNKFPRPNQWNVNCGERLQKTRFVGASFCIVLKNGMSKCDGCL